jgi:hypothetical protein
VLISLPAFVVSAQVGEAPTEEDGERCKASIEKAKAIHPNNDSVRLL